MTNWLKTEGIRTDELIKGVFVKNLFEEFEFIIWLTIRKNY